MVARKHETQQFQRGMEAARAELASSPGSRPGSRPGSAAPSQGRSRPSSAVSYGRSPSPHGTASNHPRHRSTASLHERPRTAPGSAAGSGRAPTPTLRSRTFGRAMSPFGVAGTPGLGHGPPSASASPMSHQHPQQHPHRGGHASASASASPTPHPVAAMNYVIGGQNDVYRNSPTRGAGEPVPAQGVQAAAMSAAAARAKQAAMVRARTAALRRHAGTLHPCAPFFPRGTYCLFGDPPHPNPTRPTPLPQGLSCLYYSFIWKALGLASQLELWQSIS